MHALLNCRIPDELNDRVKKIAEARGTTVSAIVREYLTDYVKNPSSTEERFQEMNTRLEALEKEVFKK